MAKVRRGDDGLRTPKKSLRGLAWLLFAAVWLSFPSLPLPRTEVRPSVPAWPSARAVSLSADPAEIPKPGPRLLPTPKPSPVSAFLDEIIALDSAALAASPEEAAPLIPQPPIRRVLTQEKVAALTFDDGPHPHLTEPYLAVLAAAGAKATFFLVGSRAQRYPEAVKMVARHGHELANHSMFHADLLGWDEAAVREDLLTANAAIQTSGGLKPRLFRSPYGHWEEAVLRGAAAARLTPVAWSVDLRDWETEDPQVLLDRLRKEVHPGAIILLHEGRPSTLKALPLLLRALKQDGYRLVTVSELLVHGRPAHAPHRPGFPSGN